VRRQRRSARLLSTPVPEQGASTSTARRRTPPWNSHLTSPTPIHPAVADSHVCSGSRQGMQQLERIVSPPQSQALLNYSTQGRITAMESISRDDKVAHAGLGSPRSYARESEVVGSVALVGPGPGVRRSPARTSRKPSGSPCARPISARPRSRRALRSMATSRPCARAEPAPLLTVHHTHAGVPACQHASVQSTPSRTAYKECHSQSMCARLLLRPKAHMRARAGDLPAMPAQPACALDTGGLPGRPCAPRRTAPCRPARRRRPARARRAAGPAAAPPARPPRPAPARARAGHLRRAARAAVQGAPPGAGAQQKARVSDPQGSQARLAAGSTGGCSGGVSARRPAQAANQRGRRRRPRHHARSTRQGRAQPHGEASHSLPPAGGRAPPRPRLKQGARREPCISGGAGLLLG